MVHYRRSRVPGATFFFTVASRDRRADTLVRHVDFLRAAVKHERARKPFVIDAMVVLPDHVHAVWTLPAGDADYSGRWRAIKSGFVRRLRAQGLALTANAKGEHAVWQRRFWEHQIRDETDLARHVDYVHVNPLKHGLVERVADWRWSTFHRYLRLGILPADWATEASVEGAFGE
jgi:putative transposase